MCFVVIYSYMAAQVEMCFGIVVSMQCKCCARVFYCIRDMVLSYFLTNNCGFAHLLCTSSSRLQLAIHTHILYTHSYARLLLMSTESLLKLSAESHLTFYTWLFASSASYAACFETRSFLRLSTGFF